MTSTRANCFNVDTGMVCITSTPLPSAADGIVTQGIFSDIGNGIANAASAAGNFLLDNALPIGLGLGAAVIGPGALTSAALNGSSFAYSLGINSLIHQNPDLEKQVSPLLTTSAAPATTSNSASTANTCPSRYQTVRYPTSRT